MSDLQKLMLLKELVTGNMEKMKIVILGPTHKSFIRSFLPSISFSSLPDGFFGAPFLGNIIESLLNKGHSVVSITTTLAIDNDYEVKEYESGNFKWVVVPYRPKSFRANGNKRGRILDLYSYERKALKKEAIKQNADFIHAHWSYEYAGALVGINIPHLVTIHDNPYLVLKFVRTPFRLGLVLLSELVLRKIRFASTVSPYMLNYAERKCQIVKVIPNPTLLSLTKIEVMQLISQKIQNIGSPVISMVMNGWDKRKNGDAGLAAFKNIHKRFPKATFHIFGKGAEVNSPAYSSLSTLDRLNITFHGPVEHTVLKSHLKSTHLLLHPSLEESFGVVLIEAMALGVPVVGGEASGAVPWVINSQELLVDLKDPGSLERKAITILEDTNFYIKHGESCFENTRDRFSPAAIVNDYETYYKEIMTQW
jgi:glycosyltransferase involved in cell wall biosynthesis